MTTLEARRIRGGLIQMYKIENSIDEINWFNPVIFKSDTNNDLRTGPRLHKYVIERQLIKNYQDRHNFFINRISGH